jgi:hypothetical protein
MKKFRIQLTESEVWWIRNLLVEEYHRERSNIRWEKKRIAKGVDRDSIAYPIKEREKHLKQKGRLLKKLSRYHNEKWFIR